MPGASDERMALRPVRDDDRELLYRIYAASRETEMARVGWSEGQKTAFLRQQFEAQDRFYRETFPQASFDVIEVAGEAAGRLYVDRRDDEIRIVDIALLPRHRGRGLGTTLLRGILREAADDELPVRIHVERFNPALALYRRLGFRRIEDREVYLLMEWRSQGDGPS